MQTIEDSQRKQSEQQKIYIVENIDELDNHERRVTTIEEQQTQEDIGDDESPRMRETDLDYCAEGTEDCE